MKNERGITLTALIIIIILLLIITTTTIYTSTNKYKINNVKKMYNDIELLNDKVASYYLKYGGLPIKKDDQNKDIIYKSADLDFDKNVNDDDKYYIIDVKAIGNITLNFGKAGGEDPGSSDDVYIINKKTQTIYYLKGVEYKNGEIFHSKKVNTEVSEDKIPPSKPSINIVSGEKDETKTEDANNIYYKGSLIIEVVPGKDNWSGVSKTTYSINNEGETDIEALINSQCKFTEVGKYELVVKTYDNSSNVSQIAITINIT